MAEYKAKGVSRSLVGLKMADRAIARHGYDVLDAEGKEKVGVVTSGTLSPSLGYPIAIAYVKSELKKVGTKLMVQVRDKSYPAEVVATPFYKRPDNK